ncbi:MAG: ABC transporter, partial [Theionarchaea archaeon]|nr:ABC transporter [Theionarchaea archaeon]
MIQVRGLRKMYKKVTAVDDLSFTVNNGEIFGLV